MRAVFDFSYDDLVDYNCHKFNSSPALKKNAFKGRVFALIAAGLVLVGEVIFGSGFERPWPSVICALLLFYLGLVQNKVNFLFLKHMLKKILEQKNSIDVFGENKLDLFEDFIRSEVDGRIWEVSYSKINRIETNGRALYLFYGSMSMIPLKLDSFSNFQEKEKFLNFMAWKLPKPMETIRVLLCDRSTVTR